MTRRPTVYGLDIETDTRTNAIDPQVARVRAVALSFEGSDEVFEGEEEDLIAELDDRLAALPPGIIATWNGAAFDLPFLADRAAVCGVPIGLRLRYDPRLGARRAPLPGHPGAYRAAWYRHGHIDAYRVYRGDTGASPRLPGGLRCLARLAGLRVVEVERDLATELEREAVHAYAAGDARLARVLTERRWPGARSHLDRRVPDTGPWVPPWFRPEPEVEVEVPAFVAVPAGRRDEAFALAAAASVAHGGDGAVDPVVIRAERADAGGGDGLVPSGEAATGVEDGTGGEEPTSDVAAWATAAGDGPDLVAGPEGEATDGESGDADGEPVVGPVADGGATELVAAVPDGVPSDRDEAGDPSAGNVAEVPPTPATAAADDEEAVPVLAAAVDAPAEEDERHEAIPAAVAGAVTGDAGGPGSPVVAVTGDTVTAGAADGDEREAPAAAPASVLPAEDRPVEVEDPTDGRPAMGDEVAAGATDPPDRGDEAGEEAARLDLTTVDVRAGAGDRGLAPLAATLFDQDAPEPASEAEVA